MHGAMLARTWAAEDLGSEATANRKLTYSDVAFKGGGISLNGDSYARERREGRNEARSTASLHTVTTAEPSKTEKKILMDTRNSSA